MHEVCGYLSGLTLVEMFQKCKWNTQHSGDELVLTTKEYMREKTSVDPKWLVEFAPGSLHYKYFCM